MRNVYISFLGLGRENKATKQWEYTLAQYRLNGIETDLTQFVQVAELSVLGADVFDRIIVVATEKSHEYHYPELVRQLHRIGGDDILAVIIGEDMSAEGQWTWFEKILPYIDQGDSLTVDMTHGYRSIPIIFSTAINLLKKAKGVDLKAAYYGAYDQKDPSTGVVPIIDMRDFFLVNEWADAISRLVEDADARKLATVSRQSPDFQIGELNDEALVRAFEELTDAIRNIDVHNIARKANEVLGMVLSKRKEVSHAGRLMLDLVVDKFTQIATEGPPTGDYDHAYFDLQLRFIDLLMEHRLYMQAFTVMREFVASLGLVRRPEAHTRNSDGRKKRNRADVFFNMIQFKEEKWDFSGEVEDRKNELLPYYRELEGCGIIRELRAFAEELARYRNGFDHAWTKRAEAPADIRQKGTDFCAKLKGVVALMAQHRIFHPPASSTGCPS